MKQEILKIPLDKGAKYLGPFDIESKPGNELTNEWEVISVTLLPGLQLAVYNRDLASILVNGADIEFLWNAEIRNVMANYENLSFVELLNAVIHHRWIP